MAADTRYFQWVVGEKRGEVMVFDTIEQDDGDLYIVFKDGSRMNESLIAELNHHDLTGKMMAEIDNPNNGWNFKEEWVGEETDRTEVDWETQTRYDVPSITEIASDGKKLPAKRKVVHLIPPRKSKPDVVASRFGNIIINPPPPPPPVVVSNGPANLSNTATLGTQSVNHSDPVYIMMDKAKKVESEVEMTLSIALPPKNLYNVAKESFDDGAEKTLEYIIENIDVIKIKEALKNGIKKMYEGGYSVEDIPYELEAPVIKDVTQEYLALEDQINQENGQKSE